MNMKRGVAALLALSAAFSMALAGCGGAAKSTTGSETSTTSDSVASTTSGNTAPESAAPATEGDKKIVVACSGTAVPYSYVENDEHKGFEVDMWNEISKRTGYEVSMVTTGFSAIFGMLDSGQADVAGNFFGMSEERLQKYDASTPYGTGNVCIAVNTDNTEINQPQDLAGKTVAVSEGTQGMQVAQELSKTIDFKLVVYGAEGTSAMQELSLGRADAWIESELTVALDSHMANLEFRVLDERPSSSKVAYFVKKDDEASKAKIEAVNKALEEMLKDGTVKTISEKWFYTDVTSSL